MLFEHVGKYIVGLSLFLIFRFGAYLMKTITYFLDIKWELRRRELIEEDRGAVVVSNHQSSLDILGG
jgi:1-acyl-sn-glycerol-3-phosphate acyltransferase